MPTATHEKKRTAEQLRFTIAGRVREKESGLGVPGLMIRAYDKDLFFDDLLGSTWTDGEGSFEITYSEKDFRELFDRKPDIYLAVYAPPSRRLLDTKDGVRWHAGEREEFELSIEREKLGDLSPTEPDDVVVAGVSLVADALTLEPRDGFDVPRLAGFVNGGSPGAPALPRQTQYVALPLGGDILGLEIEPGEAVKLPGPMNLLPVQEPVPDVGTDGEEFGDGFSIDNVHLAFTPPDPMYFERKRPYPEKLVELMGVEDIGAIRMAAVRVTPVRYDPVEKTVFFYPHLRYQVTFDFENAKATAGKRRREEAGIGLHYAEAVDKLLARDLVKSAKFLYWPELRFVEDAPHVIVSDDYAWPESVDRGDGTTRAPSLAERGAALSGDMLAEFERLAEWKTSRGLRSRVVSVSDIVDGKFGDFTQGGFARDLQEVLRNFAKHVHKHWDTVYLLLGGDLNVVPMRRLVGSSTYRTIGCWSDGSNPPLEGRCHFIAGTSVVKLRPKFTPASIDPLSTLHGGLRIPFDREAGSGRLGWYYTTEDDLKTMDEGFTRLPAGQTSRYVIVEGPGAVIEDSYYWYRSVNSIPSDLYYASLEGSGYSIPGKHDFDDNNNGLYGQYHWDSMAGMEKSLDEVDLWSDVWVGRASVESGDQARGFVDKTMTYERLETPDGEAAVDTTYLQKVLYAAAYWGRKWQWRQSDTSTPPAEAKFSHEAGTTSTKIHTDFDLTMSGGIPDRRLVARHSSSQAVVLYKTTATPSNLGWYFVTDDTYTTQSMTPTRFILVRGPESEIDPNSFFWDPVGLEGAANEKEYLRGQMNGWYPSFSSVERHYEDYFDLSSPPPIVPLESSTVRTSLNNGAHFVSLSGHGSSSGCCGVSSGDFTNENKYFIAFANSCSTARPDGVDSLGEVSTMDPDGGAVAYVGNTRYGWIGVGDNFEEFFWKKVDVFGRAGQAAGFRLATGGMKSLWTSYTQTLFGDPEMPVWTDVPSLHEVSHPAAVAWGDTFTVTVRKLGSPVAGHQVTLMGGWTSSSTRPKVLMSKTTEAAGTVSFKLPSSGASVGELKVTVTHPNFKPYVGTIEIA